MQNALHYMLSPIIEFRSRKLRCLYIVKAETCGHRCSFFEKCFPLGSLSYDVVRVSLVFFFIPIIHIFLHALMLLSLWLSLWGLGPLPRATTGRPILRADTRPLYGNKLLTLS